MKKITIKSLYFAKSFDIKEAEHLFRLLKRDFYYENVNLFGRLAVAEFESEKFEDKIKEFVNNINHEQSMTFISNVRADEKYLLDEVNYFIDAPVEILLISLLWSVTVGVLLDEHNMEGCIGNRLNIGEDKDFTENSQSAFKYYLPEYQRWRDQSIKTGLNNLNGEATAYQPSRPSRLFLSCRFALSSLLTLVSL